MLAIIGNTVIPKFGSAEIHETSMGYTIIGSVRNENEKLEILRNVGSLQKGKIEHAKFVSRSGSLVNQKFEVADVRFKEEELPDHRRLTYTISLAHPNGANVKDSLTRTA